MKILILTYLGNEGGVYTHIKNIAIRISRLADVELHILVLSQKNCIENLFGSTAHFIEKRNFRAANYLYNPFLIKKQILEIDPDIIHIHQSFNYHSIAGILLTTKYPIIVTIHQRAADEIGCRLTQSMRKNIKIKIDSFLESWLVKRAVYTILVSPHMMKYFKYLSNSKIHVIPNGVDSEEIRNTICMINPIAHPSLFFAGRLEKVKGVDTLIEAILKVRMSVPNIHLYIAGSGEEENKLKRLAKKLDIEENVTFLGFISGDEKWSYYKSTDLFVLPSLNDTAPVALPEAMACGKPVVASNVGGIPCIVEDGKTGLLFECGDVGGLAEKVITLLQNKELREKMGAAGLEKAKEFSWDEIADRTVELYREVLER